MRIRTRVLLAVGGVLAAAAIVAGHLNRNVLDGPTFAAHVDDVRRDDAVATQIGLRLSEQLIRANPDLVALKPFVDAVAVQVAGGDLLSGPTQRAASAAHEALTEPGADSVTLRIADAGAVVAGVIGAVAPERAPAATDVSVTLAAIGDQTFASTTITIAHWLGVLAWLLPLLALVCFVGAVLLSSDRRRAAAGVGTALLAAAGAVGALVVVGGFLVRQLDDDTMGGAVIRAGWSAFVRPIWWSVLLVALGAAAIRLAVSPATPASVHSLAQRTRSAVLHPTTRVGVAVRAAVAGLLGIIAIADPATAVELAVFVTGALLVAFAIAQVSSLAAPASAAPGSAASVSAAPAGTVDANEVPRERRRRGHVVFGVVGLCVLVAGAAWVARPGDDITTAMQGTGEICNGHAELCDRRFDEVAYPSSHNSMSVATEPGWFLAEQTDPIVAQLDQGVRALLIDVWSGRQAGSVVRTAPSSYEEALAIANEELGPEVVAAAQRIATSIAGVAEGPEARFLCHGLCETGSTPFLDVLAQVRSWLATHPDEVLALFIEDHVDAALIAADIESAGLLPSTYTPTPGAPWSTLREMITSGKRVVVMLEEGQGGADAPWLVNGFELTQDTPYTFPTVESFSCAPNRGQADAPLFLLNHWLSGFDSLVTDAQLVNATDVLLARAEQCRTERGQIPNFVAVNYVDIGDLYAVVDALNGVA